jgi:hypothetical protein
MDNSGISCREKAMVCLEWSFNDSMSSRSSKARAGSSRGSVELHSTHFVVTAPSRPAGVQDICVEEDQDG